MAQAPRTHVPFASSRLEFFRTILPRSVESDALIGHLRDFKSSDIPETIPGIAPSLVQQASLINKLGDVTSENADFVGKVVSNPKINSLRDAAFHLDTEEIERISKTLETDGAAPLDVRAISTALFQREAGAVIQRLVQSNQIKLPPELNKEIDQFLEQNPDFNFRESRLTSVQSLNAFKGKTDVFESLARIQRVRAITPEPTVLSKLLNAGVTSAHAVSRLFKQRFIDQFKDTLTTSEAATVHDYALQISLRNEAALMQILEAVKGTGLAAIDGLQTPKARLMAFQAAADGNNYDVDLETLFGPVDYFDTDDCLSVFSPTSYFVELMQFLRTTMLDGPDILSGGTDTASALSKLLQRRPDLRDIELTCENANTLVPYLDLANEIMESFIVSMVTFWWPSDIPIIGHKPVDQVEFRIKAFNVGDETSNELLAEPQHTDLTAYNLLAQDVYPLVSLPFHQPLTATRIYLRFLKTSRAELLKTFSRPVATIPPNLSPDEEQQFRNLYDESLTRSISAEVLNIIPEEYPILTQESFKPKRYLEMKTGSAMTDAEYQQRSTWKSVHEYWGYDSEEAMLSRDATKPGLSFLKAEFLPRSGMSYSDVVDLLKTEFVNPVYKPGLETLAFQTVRSKYRYLKTLVDVTAAADVKRYGQVIDYAFATARGYLEAKDPFHFSTKSKEALREEIAQFVYQHFEKLGGMVVLESGEDPLPPDPAPGKLAISGELYRWIVIPPGGTHFDELEGRWFFEPDDVKFFGTLDEDGWIVNRVGGIGQVVGRIAKNSIAYALNGTPFFDQRNLFPWNESGVLMVTIKQRDQPSFDAEYTKVVGMFTKSDDGLLRRWDPVSGDGDVVPWIPDPATSQPTSTLPAELTVENLAALRIRRLDGTKLESSDWSSLSSFIRLKARTGLSTDELDKAIAGFSPTSPPNTPPPPSRDTTAVGGGLDKMTPTLLRELASLKQLKEATGAEVIKLLVLSTDISTAGSNSLYQRLFLTHNLLGIDYVFTPDATGAVLNSNEKIADHFPVILAALNIRQAELEAILADARRVPPAAVGELLTLPAISRIYAYAFLAQLLRITISELIQAVRLFDYSPGAATATETLEFINQFKLLPGSLSIPELAFVFLGEDRENRFSLNRLQVMKATGEISDGLKDMKAQYPEPLENAQPSFDDVNKLLELIYPPELVAKVSDLLGGPDHQTADSVATRAPIPEESSSGVSAAGTAGQTLPNPTVIPSAGGVSGGSGIAIAADRIVQQRLDLFDSHLASIFPDVSSARGVLLTPGISDTPKSRRDKRHFFLRYFVPYLQRILGEKLVIETLTKLPVTLEPEMLRLLLSQVLTLLVDGNSKPCLTKLLALKGDEDESRTGKATLLPPSTDAYTFSVQGPSIPKTLTINGNQLAFVRPLAESANVWVTDPIQLTGGQLYTFDIGTQSLRDLKWHGTRNAATPIPSANLIQDSVYETVEKVLTKLIKAKACIHGLGLSFDEVSYFQSASGQKGFGFNLDSASFVGFRQLLSYSSLRAQAPQGAPGLIDIFKWASDGTSEIDPNEQITLVSKIASVTGWNAKDITKLLGPEGWNLRRTSFVNEMPLLRLQSALGVSSKVSVDISTLFKWTSEIPTFVSSPDDPSAFDHLAAISNDIRKSIRSRYKLEDWEQAVKPLHDELRSAQRDALIAHLLVHPAIKSCKIKDADELFEWFLIDVQMGSCLKTSRIKQAISTIHQFVQRCILGLETERYPALISSAFDQERWKWMSKQTVWTANRKVFLHPESYLEPSLRDDKSDLYEVLESELMQKDVNPESVRQTVQNYLFNLQQRTGLLVQGIFDDTKNAKGRVAHFVGRTRHQPAQFFHRTFSFADSSWAPWRVVSIDIPSYTAESFEVAADPPSGPKTTTTSDHNPGSNAVTLPASTGSYVIPIVFRKRTFILFGILLPVTKAKTATETLDFSKPQETGEKLKSLQTWGISIGWTELRGGKWSAKKVSTDSIIDWNEGADKKTDTVLGSTPPPVDMYQFIPLMRDNGVRIGLYNLRGGLVRAFWFDGNQISVLPAETDPKILNWDVRTSFHVAQSTRSNWGSPVEHAISTLQNVDSSFEWKLTVSVWDDKGTMKVQLPGLHGAPMNKEQPMPFDHPSIGALLEAGATMDTLAPLASQLGTQYGIDMSQFGVSSTGSNTTDVSSDELSTAYSLYLWELGFHAPMALADKLLKSQNFEAALDCCHFVFNPHAGGKSPKEAWTWRPFANTNPEGILEAIFSKLKPGTPDDPNSQISRWRNNPFAPHVIARERIVAYMKWTVMKYLEILIAYGDWHFRQGTLEALPQALQLYVLARQIYGPKPQQLPSVGTRKPETYKSLYNTWDAFSNAAVEMELAFPFSDQGQSDGANGGTVQIPNVLPLVTTRYFSIPQNPKLLEMRNLIDQRIYNIRNCLDINGKSISYPLYDPPIDPAVLVSAIAQGLSLSSVLNDLNSPMPNYRFFYLLQKAIELCAELKSYSNSFLAIKEKIDSEALSTLRLRQEVALNNMVMDLRNLQLEEANKSLEALRESRNGPLARYKYYSSLAGSPVKAFSETDTEFKELELQIQPPTAKGDLTLTDVEMLELDEAKKAKEWNEDSASGEMLASLLLSMPVLTYNFSYMGVGYSITPGQRAYAEQGDARFLRSVADSHTYASADAVKKAAYIKQHQDRVSQANFAGYELMNINKQIVTQLQRIKIAAQEIANQQKNIENSQETLDFMNSKYTNSELYTYMENSVRTTFYQMYTLAYELAKKAEATFIFERGPQASATPFIRFGYWDPKRDGLQCGDALHLSLKQLESAYLEKRAYDFEISKTVSLRQIAPMDLIELRRSGTCTFSIPEMLFDIDFPGHYMRRIKSLSVSIPCVVGPYTGVNATLSLVEHKYRVQPTSGPDAGSYVQKDDNGADGPDTRFTTTKVPISSIAVSDGRNDAGVFELSFASERYLPFEGAGAISTWKLELPQTLRSFDYGSIADVVLHLRYTSLNGGATLKAGAQAAVEEYVKNIDSASQNKGLYAILDLQAEFSSEWARAAAKCPAGSNQLTRQIAMKDLAERLPFYTRGRTPSAHNLKLITETDVNLAKFELKTSDSTETVHFDLDPTTRPGLKGVNVMSGRENAGLDIVDSTWALIINGGAELALKRIWMVLQLVLS